MIWYRLLFLNRKTFTVASVGAFALMIVSMTLMASTNQLTIFTAVCFLLTLILCAGLAAAWKKGDILRTSGLVGGILLVVLCRYTYLSEQYLSIGVDAIVALGMVQCMIFSAYLMVAFIILMVTYNHFSIQVGKNSGRTKLVCIFCLTMLMLIQGFANNVYLAIWMLTVLQAAGLIWYLHEKIRRRTSYFSCCSN